MITILFVLLLSLTSSSSSSSVVVVAAVIVIVVAVEAQRFLLLHLLLQQYLWGAPFWVRYLRMSLIFNLTIEVITFRLCGCCMPGVFLLPAFTHLGHECQDLFSPYNGMHACTN